jgi:hypothetical protein
MGQFQIPLRRFPCCGQGDNHIAIASQGQKEGAGVGGIVTAYANHCPWTYTSLCQNGPPVLDTRTQLCVSYGVVPIHDGLAVGILRKPFV